jgi:hypothetical protein
LWGEYAIIMPKEIKTLAVTRVPFPTGVGQHTLIVA